MSFKLNSWLITIKVYNSYWGDYLKQYAYDLLRQEVKTYQDLKAFRHDFVNHVNVVKLYLQMGMVDESINYIDKLSEFVDESGISTKITGNLEIDMLMSSKIQKLYEIGCKIDISSNLTAQLKLDIFDVVSILGNLLDNCYEALINTKEKRLSLDINVIYDTLYVSIVNTHNNKMLKCGDDILTTKTVDAKDHGIGIKSIKNCVKKHNGKMVIEYDENEFITEISIPLTDDENYSWDKKAW